MSFAGDFSPRPPGLATRARPAPFREAEAFTFAGSMDRACGTDGAAVALFRPLMAAPSNPIAGASKFTPATSAGGRFSPLAALLRPLSKGARA